MNRRRMLAAAGALPALRPGTIVAQALLTIRVASTANDDATPIVYGQSSGIFRAAGLDVVFQKANSGSAVAAAVASGAIDVGKSSIEPIINAHARGIPFVAIAPSSIHHDGSLDSGLVVANDGPHTARELNGQIVSVAGLQDTTWLSARAWLDANGADSASVRFVEVPGSSVLYALEQGRIVAGTMSEPYITQNVKSGQARLLANTLDAIARRWLLAAFFTTGDYVARNRETVVRFRHAVAQASAYCNAHQAETVPLMAAFTGLEPQLLAQVSRAYFATELDPREIQPTIEAAAKYKVIDKPFDARELFGRLAS